MRIFARRAADPPDLGPAATVTPGGDDEQPAYGGGGYVGGPLPPWARRWPVDMRAAASSAVAFAAGLWARSCQGARVIGPAGGIQPVLGDGAWQLVSHGEACWFIDLDAAGEVRLVPVTHWWHNGGVDNDTWTVTATMAAPSGQRTITAPESMFVRWPWRTDPAQPWRGIGPLDSSRASTELLALSERRHRDIAGSPTGQVLRVGMKGARTTEQSQEDTLAKLGQRISGVSGEVVALVSAELSPTEASNEAMHNTDIGVHPDATDHAVFRDAWMHVVQACGVPAGLVDPNAASTARESFRLWMGSSVSPMLHKLAMELTAKLGEPYAFDLADLRLTDLAARARAFAQLVANGVTAAAAASEVGFSPDLAASTAQPAGEDPEPSGNSSE